MAATSPTGVRSKASLPYRGTKKITMAAMTATATAGRIRQGRQSRTGAGKNAMAASTAAAGSANR